MKLRLPAFIKRAFSTSSYPFPPGSQNNDGFERNLDVRMLDALGRDRQLRISTVWACARLISGTISTLPLNVFARNDDGSRRFAPEFPLYTVLHDIPNADMTAQTFWQCVVLSLLFNGEAYGEKQIGALGRVIGVEYLDYRRMTWTYVNGERIWRYTARDGVQRVIPRENLFRVMGFTLDGACGLSAIEYGARMFNSADLADMAANRTFHNGLMPTVAFTMERVLQKTQRDEFRAFAKKITGAWHAGESPILEGGVKAEPIGINPNDAQLLESRAWSVEEICRWFGVPPFMVGHSEKSTTWGTGLEQQNIGFLTYCLRFYLKAIEQAISKELLTPAQRQRYYAEFAIEGLLRADSAARAALYASAAQNGWMKRSEIRALENLEPDPTADVLTAQSNLLPLDKLGAAVAPAPALEDALKNFLGMVQP